MINKLLYGLISKLLWLYCITWRFKSHNTNIFYSRRAQGKRNIVVIWHDQLLPLTFQHRGWQLGTLASQSKDGEIITQQLKRWGYLPARGSSTRGGAKAIVEMKRIMNNGHDMCLTVDGPKGPRHVVKQGVIFMAKQVDCVIIPAVLSVKHYKRFASWDRFVLPLPFARIDTVFGDPIKLSDSKDPDIMEQERLKVEQAMLALTEKHSANIANP